MLPFWNDGRWRWHTADRWARGRIVQQCQARHLPYRNDAVAQKDAPVMPILRCILKYQMQLAEEERMMTQQRS